MKRSDLAWLPNLMTAFNVFLGFWAILMTVQGNHLTACWLIIIASISDGLDGKLARFVHSSSEMGIEMDSLADVVSFGVAPGVLLYWTAFQEYGFAGIVLASVPLLFGMIRLARYNATAATTGEKKAFFEGLPIPMQADAIAAFILFNHALWGQMKLELVLVPMTLVLAFLMVSHLPYDALPRLSFRDMPRHPVKAAFILGFILLLAVKPAIVFFPLMVAYLLRGVLMGLLGLAPEEEAVDEEDLESNFEVKP
ncbi:MAG: CDP-diacylglycerol--serine O-phosphatidyltransferase [Candidatus Zixiibacteriota bacterium]|nr:MAG: CDP-diacylglycerol--serine O-phosphatidyltransferase [candidate division Zixibacteria bacterium]